MRKFSSPKTVLRPRTIHYHEESRADFGLLKVIHLHDLFMIETQVGVEEKGVVYGMRLGWRRGVPPLSGELVSLHLPKSKILVRVSRVTRTCVCCAKGVVYLHVEQVPGVLPDEKVCECARIREMRTAVGWRDVAEEVACPRKSRAVLRRISDILEKGGIA